MRDLDWVALLVACPYCHAAPGSWCVTVRGHHPGTPVRPYLHEGRSRPGWEGWRAGYLAGEQHVVAMLDLTESTNTPEQTAWWRGFLTRIRQGSPV